MQDSKVVLELGTPNEKQDIALKDKHRYVAFGGARGGGKSYFVRYKAILLCLFFAGITVCIVRKTYPELTENHIKPLVKLLRCHNADKKQRLASYNDGKKTLTFPNGSTILFRYCANQKDLGHFQGTEMDVLFLDEATQFDEETFRELDACVRGVNGFPKRVYLTCNPGGVGHQWVKRLFIDKVYNDNENPDEYSFIQSKVTDNKALMESNPQYINNLKALPSKIRAAWLDGDWNVFTGQFFEEWRNSPNDTNQWTHVIEPFDIPVGWKIYRSFDWGYSRPFSVGWWAIDYQGRLYRILEWYGCTGEANEGLRMTADAVFKEIKQIESTHPYLKNKKIVGVADPAIWSKDGGYSINDYAERNGVYFQKGDHQRVAGWMQCHYRLAFDENGFPMMYVFSHCRDFIRTIVLQMHDDHKVEDLDSNLEDHACDEFRYMAMLRTIPPRKNVVKKRMGDNPLDIKEI